MKKLLIRICLIGILGLLVFLSVKTKKGDTSIAIKHNIAFLTAAADGETTTPSNTGPRETVDCKGVGTGNKEVCKCENSIGCEDSACY